MDFVKSHLEKMKLWPVEHFWLTFFPDQHWICADLEKSEPKVFNWSEFHFSEVTCYKIHTLISTWQLRVTEFALQKWQTWSINCLWIKICAVFSLLKWQKLKDFCSMTFKIKNLFFVSDRTYMKRRAKDSIEEERRLQIRLKEAEK